jgi:hypothetical protein
MASPMEIHFPLIPFARRLSAASERLERPASGQRTRRSGWPRRCRPTMRRRRSRRPSSSSWRTRQLPQPDQRADDAADDGEQDRLREKLRPDLTLRRAKGAAEADLRAAFQHRDDHDGVLVIAGAAAARGGGATGGAVAVASEDPFEQPAPIGATMARAASVTASGNVVRLMFASSALVVSGSSRLPARHCCILGSCVGSAYVGGQPRAVTWARSS